MTNKNVTYSKNLPRPFDSRRISIFEFLRRNIAINEVYVQDTEDYTTHVSF